MFTICGATRRPRGAISRREMLRIGGLGVAGLTLPDLVRARAARADTAASPSAVGFGTAKACIILFMRGGPSHQDTWDLKPNAPAEIRGEFKPIATNVSGIHISEHFPLLAQRADRYAILRSVSSGQADHVIGCHNMLTGNLWPEKALATGAFAKPKPDDYPHYGSVLARQQPGSGTVPPFIYLPISWNDPGQGAGFLGQRYDPFWIRQDPNVPDFRLKNLDLPKDVSLDRLAGRSGLLEAMNRQADVVLRSAPVTGMDNHYQNALQMISSPQARRAFDLSSEPGKVRDTYGRHTFGQSVLLARRLVEHGVPLVTVNWTNYAASKGRPGADHWDTHGSNFPALKYDLMPPTDMACAALLDDLATRGLLKETLVVWMGEIGRTPRIRAGGRDHWGGCMSVVLAGGGIRGGQVYGASDKSAAYAAESPVHSKDLGTTIYHCLGVAPEVPDNLGRPVPICNGTVVKSLFG